MRKDLKKHYKWGIVIFAITYIFYFLIFRESTDATLVALFATILAGAAKEVIWDLILKKGRFQISDFVATSAAGFTGAFIVEIYKLIF